MAVCLRCIPGGIRGVQGSNPDYTPLPLWPVWAVGEGGHNLKKERVVLQEKQCYTGIVLGLGTAEVSFNCNGSVSDSNTREISEGSGVRILTTPPPLSDAC